MLMSLGIWLRILQNVSLWRSSRHAHLGRDLVVDTELAGPGTSYDPPSVARKCSWGGKISGIPCSAYCHSDTILDQCKILNERVDFRLNDLVFKFFTKLVSS